MNVGLAEGIKGTKEIIERKSWKGRSGEITKLAIREEKGANVNI